MKDPTNKFACFDDSPYNSNGHGYGQRVFDERVEEENNDEDFWDEYWNNYFENENED